MTQKIWYFTVILKFYYSKINCFKMLTDPDTRAVDRRNNYHHFGLDCIVEVLDCTFAVRIVIGHNRQVEVRICCWAAI